MSSCKQDFNVEIIDNVFNFITASFSEMEGWVKRFSFDFDYTRVFVETFNYDRIKIFTSLRKRLVTGYYIREKLIKFPLEFLISGCDFTIINKVNFFHLLISFG